MVLVERAIDAEGLPVLALRLPERLPRRGGDPLVPGLQPLQQHLLPRLVPSGAVHHGPTLPARPAAPHPARPRAPAATPLPTAERRAIRPRRRRRPRERADTRQSTPAGTPVRIGGQRHPQQHRRGHPAHRGPPPAPHQGVTEPEPGQVEQRSGDRPQRRTGRRRPDGRRLRRRRRHGSAAPGPVPRNAVTITGLHNGPPPPSRKVTGNLPLFGRRSRTVAAASSGAGHARSRQPLRAPVTHGRGSLFGRRATAAPAHRLNCRTPRLARAPAGALRGTDHEEAAHPGRALGRHLRRAVRLGIRVHAAYSGRPGRLHP